MLSISKRLRVLTRERNEARAEAERLCASLRELTDCAEHAVASDSAEARQVLRAKIEQAREVVG